MQHQARWAYTADITAHYVLDMVGEEPLCSVCVLQCSEPSPLPAKKPLLHLRLHRVTLGVPTAAHELAIGAQNRASAPAAARYLILCGQT